jgi:hypothetical protein
MKGSRHDIFYNFAIAQVKTLKINIGIFLLNYIIINLNKLLFYNSITNLNIYFISISWDMT